MSRKTLTLVFSLSILSLVHLSGCGVFSTEPDGKSLSIDSRILFNIKESSIYARPTPSFHLHMETEKIYPCYNYLIKESTDKTGSLIHIALREIFAPEICLTAEGPAQAIKPLELANGTYFLQFTYRLKLDRYRLTVLDSSVQIDPITSSFTAADTTIP